MSLEQTISNTFAVIGLTIASIFPSLIDLGKLISEFFALLLPILQSAAALTAIGLGYITYKKNKTVNRKKGI